MGSYHAAVKTNLDQLLLLSDIEDGKIFFKLKGQSNLKQPSQSQSKPVVVLPHRFYFELAAKDCRNSANNNRFLVGRASKAFQRGASCEAEYSHVSFVGRCGSSCEGNRLTGVVHAHRCFWRTHGRDKDCG